MSKIYAKIGSNSMTVVADNVRYSQAADEVLMSSPRPEGDYIASETGEWVIDKAKQLKEIDEQYDQDKSELIRYYNEAVFEDDVEIQNELKEELQILKNEYVENRKALEEEM